MSSPSQKTYKLTLVMYERMRVIYRQTDVGDIGPNIKTIEEKKEKKSQ